MPLHFEDLDVVSQTKGSRSALIVPCSVCPAATIAVREKRPFLKLFSNFLKSAPFENYLAALQDLLAKHGVRTKVFRNNLPHQWFLCMWTASRQKKLKKYAQDFETVIVLGCESATETVRDSIQNDSCRVVEGMRTAGITNTTLCFTLPANISFQDSRIIPFSSEQLEKTEDLSGVLDRNMQKTKSCPAKKKSWSNCLRPQEEMG